MDKNSKKINLIVAVDDMWGISKNGKIPWKITEDTNFFCDVTTKHNTCSATNKKNVLVMGKNTWLSLPNYESGLKDRIVIVVSSSLNNIDLSTNNIFVVTSLQAAINFCESNDIINEIFVCGGSQLYKEALDALSINNLYLTMIKKDYKCDNFFPATSLTDGVLRNYSKSFVVKDLVDDTTVEVTFCKYTRYSFDDYDLFSLNKLKNVEENTYLNLLEDIIKNGAYEQTRNAFTWSIFGKQLSFDLSKGFPLLTTKKVFFKGVVEELLFFLRGNTNAKHLSEKGVKIWEQNTSREFLDSVGLQYYEEGDMGPMYGYQLFHFGAKYEGMNINYYNLGFNQIQYCLHLLKYDPFSRRIMMTTYDPSVAKEGCLYPCHGVSIIFNVKKKDDNFALSCMMTQRSADMFLGVPFNIASYALLIHILCEVINNDETYTGKRYIPGTLIMSLGDAHIYESHYTQCIRQILRESYTFPQLKINKNMINVTDLAYEDIELVNYMCYPTITAKMVA